MLLVFQARWHKLPPLTKGTAVKIHPSMFAVVGEREKTSSTVNVRTRDNKVHGEFSVADVIERFSRLKREFVPDSEESF